MTQLLTNVINFGLNRQGLSVDNSLRAAKRSRS
jgi:hypothetical protein